jgi:hypothetical protein
MKTRLSSLSDRRGEVVAVGYPDVAERLAGHEGRDDDERTVEIRRWCLEGAEQLETAPIQGFVPILVEHLVHNRMIETRAAMPTPPAGAKDRRNVAAAFR